MQMDELPADSTEERGFLVAEQVAMPPVGDVALGASARGNTCNENTGNSSKIRTNMREQLN